MENHTLHTVPEWQEIERLQQVRKDAALARATWSNRLAERARQSIRRAFNSYLDIKKRYRDNMAVFQNICFEMSGTKILASLREFKQIVKYLVRDARAWALIPLGERDLIIKAAKMAGVMVMVPAYILLKG